MTLLTHQGIKKESEKSDARYFVFYCKICACFLLFFHCSPLSTRATSSFFFLCPSLLLTFWTPLFSSLFVGFVKSFGSVDPPILLPSVRFVILSPAPSWRKQFFGIIPHIVESHQNKITGEKKEKKAYILWFVHSASFRKNEQQSHLTYALLTYGTYLLSLPPSP